jgi:cystathionine beta-lyase/cystathionine gamma-synthase
MENNMVSESFATQAVLDARAQTPANAPAALPIFTSAGWVFRSLDEVDAIYEGRLPGAVYGGSGVPNHEALESVVASLHGAQAALATTAGMSAFSVALLALARSGARVLAAHDLYGNTTTLLRDFARFGVDTHFVDVGDHNAVDAALREPCIALVVESISNPRIRVADIAALAQLAHARGVLLLVDNTLASPYHCRPLDLGADLVIESITKFLGGHHDVVAGCIAGSRARIEPMRMLGARAGLIGSVFETWLAVRSIATLDVRMARSTANALEIARRLARHAKVRTVYYPGLESATARNASRTLRNGFGSVLSFEIEPRREAVDRLLGALKAVRLVLSFGGVATTLSHPATSSHRSLSQAEREKLGIHDGFLRLSVGIEDVEDTAADLERGLSAI